MLRFGIEPHLQPLRVPRKSKSPFKYKEQKHFRPKQIETRLYKDRPQEVKDSIKQAVMNHTARLKFRATPSDRRQHNRKKREYLRAKYKKLGIMRTCTHCHVNRPITDFDLQKDSTHPAKQRRPYCFICRKEKNRADYLRRKHDTK